MGHLAKAETAETEISVVASGASADAAAVVQPYPRVLAFDDQLPSLVFLVDH